MTSPPKFICIILTALSIHVSLLSFSQTTVIDSIISGGIYRSYRLYIPTVYNSSTAHPLIFDLHGYTSTALEEQFYSNFMPIADTANFLTVYPQGTLLGGQPYWNAGLNPNGVNDVGFISDLIDSLSTKYNIDPNGVYSCGMSNGGYMSHTLACTLNNRIVAIASVTGSMFTGQRTTCSPNRAVPVMQVSGTADGTVAYTGSAGSLAIDTVVQYWVMNNNCNPIPVFNNVPNISTTDGCTAEHYVYNGGDNGSSVEFYKIIGGDHTWPGSPYIIGTTNQDFSASEKIWLFFKKYKLNQFTGIEEVNNNTLSIFPNPCSSLLNIKGEEIDLVTILDMNGKQIISTSEKQIDISKFAPGIYSVVLLNNKNKMVQKLVKM